MKWPSGKWGFFVMVLMLGFIIGVLLAPSLGFHTSFPNQEREKEAYQPKADPQIHDLMSQISQAFETAAEKASASVVSIFAEQTVQAQNPFGFPDDALKDFFGEDMLRRFFGTPQPREEKRTVRSLGSGVVMTSDGYILTNNHVVANADKLSVIVGDKKTYVAKVIGTDPPTDVAVIKIDAKDLRTATMGDSDKVKVGQWIIAVGNPFQLFHTVTHGIISAKGRSSMQLAEYEDFLQTDAPINPGNSGGAMADLEGNLIGINTAIASPSGGNVGIGFAIPINMAKQVMDDLVSKGKVTRGYIGLVPQDIDENMAKALKLSKSEGVLVADVDSGGPADKAGVKRGDIIIEFNGKKIENSTQLRNLAAQAQPKEQVKIVVLRDGDRKELTVTLAEKPKAGGAEESPQSPQEEHQSSEKLGLSVQTLTPEIADQLGYQNERGAVVAEVISGGPADEVGLQSGDLIKEVNRKQVRTAQEFEREIRDLKKGDAVALLVRRGQNTFYVALSIQ